MFFLLISFDIGSSFAFMYLLRLFICASTHFSTMSNPLPPSYLFKYNLPTFYLGCSATFIVIIIRVLISILSISCIAQSMTPTTHMLILSIIFFEYSFDSTSFFTLLRYSSSSFSLYLIWSSCSISKYLYPAVSICLNASFFLVALSTSYTCPCQTSYLRLGRTCALCLLKSLVLFHSSLKALGHP